MESEEQDKFKACVEQQFRALTGRDYLPHEDGQATLKLSDLFAAFERLVVVHHEVQVSDDEKYKQLEVQLDDISEAFNHLQKDVNRLNGDKLISIKIPDKPRHLQVQKDDSSDEDANSFLPEEDSTAADVKQREKELRQQLRDKRSQRQASNSSEEPEPEIRIPRDGLPELYRGKLEPVHRADEPIPLAAKQVHVHSHRCPCKHHDHRHLLLDPHESPEGFRK